MYLVRQSAVRLLTSRSFSIAARPRTITSFARLPSQSPRTLTSVHFQRRWASNEAEAKKEDEGLPVSQLQPTPQEEVENAIHEDNAAATDAAPQIAETANATEATEDATTTAAESEPVQAATDSIRSESPAARLTEGISGDSSRAERRSFRDPPEPNATVYVGNLFFDVTENDLTKEFGRFGTPKHVRIVRDARGLSKGFGYIAFETTEQAQSAIAELNQQLFEGRRLMVSFAHSPNAAEPRSSPGRPERPLNPPSKTLFIGNMSFEMTDRDLNNLFRGIRNVVDVRVAIDRRTGQPRGFAHADFVDVKSAMEAMKLLAGKENYGRRLRIDYSYGPSTAPRNTPT